MKIILVWLSLFAFSFMTNSAFAGGCGGDHSHSSESSDKKKKRIRNLNWGRAYDAGESLLVK